MSGPRMNNSLSMNGSNRRPTNIGRIQTVERSACTQHDDLIKFIYDSWSKITQEMNNRNNGNAAVYYNEQETDILKNFEPFDLETWGNRLIPNMQQSHRS